VAGEEGDDEMTYPTTTTLKVPEVCKCCAGVGTQYNMITGLRVRCPCCGGTGKMSQAPPTYEVVS